MSVTYILGGAWQAEHFHYSSPPLASTIFTHPITGEEILICDEHAEVPYQPGPGRFVKVRDGLWVATKPGRDEKDRPYWDTVRRDVGSEP